MAKNNKNTAPKRQKKESVVDYLQNGTPVPMLWENGKPIPGMVKITTATGSYTMPDDKDIWKQIDSRTKALDRWLSNKLNYGDDRGRSGVFRDTPTALDLAMLRDRPDYLRCAYRAYTMSLEAPQKLRPTVYHNLIVRANEFHHDSEHFRLRDIAAYTFEVLPPAWRKCMNAPCPELSEVTLQDVLAEVKPAYKPGDRVARRMITGKWVLCEVVGSELRHKYGYKMRDAAFNPYTIYYRVKPVGDRSRTPNIYDLRSDIANPESCYHEADPKNRV